MGLNMVRCTERFPKPTERIACSLQEGHRCAHFVKQTEYLMIHWGDIDEDFEQCCPCCPVFENCEHPDRYVAA